MSYGIAIFVSERALGLFMKFSSKILNCRESESNEKNQLWWEENPMIYDWDRDFGDITKTEEYFSKIDELFASGHMLVNNPEWPNGYVLENFIPYHLVNGKDVLEIGCGAGLVASHLAQSGANLHAIDLTENAVSMTKKRFSMLNLKGEISQMDAEKMVFSDNSFDYVISWGVIHHSGNMEKIIQEINRVLRPGGRAYIMVYNKNSLRYRLFCPLWLGVIKGKLFKSSFSDIVGSITDGYIARHLTKAEFKVMAHQYNSVEFSFSDEVNTTLSYFLGPVRRILFITPKIFRKALERLLAKKWGWYMQVKLDK